MFIVLLTYVKSADEVEAMRGEHRAWLAQGYAAGHYLGWGPQEPRNGGVVFAKGQSKAQVAERYAADPFVVNGIATFEVVEFAPAFLDPSIAGMAS
jgi:uncharacterized protein YciI